MLSKIVQGETMKPYSTEKIRNIVLAGHSGSGKTSLTEALLFSTGAVERLGKIENGQTTTDYGPEEIKRRISINTAIAVCQWNKHKLNLIDTPGYTDFVGEVISAIRAADGGIIVVDAVHGVQVQTEKSWSLMEDNKYPRMFFVNRMDKENADFDKILADLQDYFGKTVAPLQLPIGKAADFKGIIDILEDKAYITGPDDKVIESAIPDELHDNLDAYREQLMEAIAESDDDLLEKYLDDGELSATEMIAGIKKAVHENKLVPVLCGSALKNIGSTELLKEIVRCLPSPRYRGDVVGNVPDNKDEEVSRPPHADAPMSAFVFKSISDPYVGKLNLVRVFSGILQTDSHIINYNKEKEEKVSHLYYMMGKQQLETKEIIAGDIGAIPKLSVTSTGDTLADKDGPIIFPPIDQPEPLVSLAIRPKAKSDDEKIGSALHKLTDEDATLTFKRNPITHENILSGLGFLHLSIILDRLSRRFNLEVETAAPKIAYQESIKRKVKVQGRYKKQTGGRGQYGDVWLEVEPLPRGKGFEFVDKIFGGAVPKNYIPAVEKGIRESMEKGVFTHYPTVDFRVTLVDGSYHPVDSSEMAFKIAGSMAFKKAVMEAKPYLLEPIYNIEVIVPEANTGDVMGDLSGKRGKIIGIEPLGNKELIKAKVPLGEIAKYSTELRSITSGRGSYSISYSHYEELPPDAAKKIIEAAKKDEEE